MLELKNSFTHIFMGIFLIQIKPKMIFQKLSIIFHGPYKIGFNKNTRKKYKIAVFLLFRDQHLDDKIHATQKPYVRIEKFLHPYIHGNIPDTDQTKNDFSKIIYYFSWAIQNRLQ